MSSSPLNLHAHGIVERSKKYEQKFKGNNEFSRIVSTAYMKAKKRPNVQFDMGNEQCDNILNTWSAIR